MNKSDLIQMVAERTGIGPDKASQAVDVVIDQLARHLPGGIGAQIEGFLSGGSATGGSGVGDIASGLGGMLGKK